MDQTSSSAIIQREHAQNAHGAGRRYERPIYRRSYDFTYGQAVSISSVGPRPSSLKQWNLSLVYAM